jgi:hypothetical protein
MRHHEYTWHDDKAAFRLAPQGDDSRIDFCVAANGRTEWHDLESPGSRLKWEHISRYGTGLRIEHNCGPLEPKRNLGEQLKPLASQPPHRYWAQQKNVEPTSFPAGTIFATTSAFSL